MPLFTIFLKITNPNALYLLNTNRNFYAMKFIVLSTILLFSINVNAQFTRSFYTSSSANTNHSTIVTNGNVDKFVSIKESTTDTLVIITGIIDAKGETSDYTKLVYPLPSSLYHSLLGAGLAPNGNVVLSILYQSSPFTKLICIETDGTTISQVNINAEIFNRGFTRSVFSSDSIITYLGKSTGGLYRISKPLNDLSLSYEELVDTGNTVNVVMIQSKKFGELIIVNDTEYFIYRTSLVKRISAGNYQSNALSVIPVYPFNLTMNDNNELVVFYGNNYFVFDQNFNQIQTGNLGITPISSSVWELFYENGYVLYGMNSSNSGRMVFDDSFSLIDELELSNTVPFGHKKRNGMHYIFGRKIEPIRINVNLDGLSTAPISNSLFLIKEDTTRPQDFIEYNRTLIHKKMKAHVGHLGNTFSKASQSSVTAGLYFQKPGVDIPMIYYSATSLLGKNNVDSLLGFININDNTYPPSLLPGPITNSIDYSHEIMDKYNRGYLVTRTMIEDHITAIGNSTQNYNIPFAIEFWPAHGDVSIGQSQNLAPYIDRNLNGIYDPENGDYPKIIGDRCLLYISHQSESSTNSAVYELLQYIYTFNCETSKFLKNTIFVQSDFIGRGVDLDSVYLSSFLDFDIGSPYDDYIGTNVDLGLSYGYNGDPYDENSAPFGFGFGDTIPAVGAMILSGVKGIADGIDNNFGPYLNESTNGIGFGDAISDNEKFGLTSSLNISSAIVNLPTSLSGVYFIYQGLDTLGNAQTNGNGVEIKHSYYGQSDPLFYSSGGVNHGNNLSESNSSNQPGDRRMLSNSGPGTLNIGDTLSITSAYLVGLDTINISNNASVNRLFSLASDLKIAFANNSLGCNNSFDPYISTNEASLSENEINYFNLFPNPTTGKITVSGTIGESSIKVLDTKGSILFEKTFNSEVPELDLSHLENAVYFLIVTDENNSQVFRIVKR